MHPEYQPTDFQIVNRVVSVAAEIIDTIICPVCNLSRDIYTTYYETTLDSFLSSDYQVHGEQLDEICEQISSQYRVPSDLVRRSAQYPLALLAFMCIDYRSMDEVRNG